MRYFNFVTRNMLLFQFDFYRNGSAVAVRFCCIVLIIIYLEEDDIFNLKLNLFAHRKRKIKITDNYLKLELYNLRISDDAAFDYRPLHVNVLGL